VESEAFPVNFSSLKFLMISCNFYLIYCGFLLCIWIDPIVCIFG
jgi:hypothetical protein